MLHRRACGCCSTESCWWKLAPCCTEHDDAYITCTDGYAVRIAPTGEGQHVIKFEGQCYIVETFDGEPPEGATILTADDLEGNIEFFDDCGPDGCCPEPDCWYVARKCCDVMASCELTPGVPEPPEEMYVDCDTIDNLVFMASIVLPTTFHPYWYGEFPDCIPCYTIDDGDTVDTLPFGALEWGGPYSDEVDCDAEDCCPEADRGGCESECAMPTFVSFDLEADAESFGGCPCDQPENPQAWKVGNFTDALACDGESAVSMNNCKLRYELTFACVPVVEEAVVVAIFYRVSLAFFLAATIGPNDPDCLGDGCGETFPGVQTCADPCGDTHSFILRTPDLAVTACPHAADFTILESSLNMVGTPIVTGFGYT